jgi:integrase/recombinase XerC
LKTECKAAPATINHVLAVLDDFHTRLGLGPAAIRREERVGRTAPRALDDQAARRYWREVERLPSPRDRVIAALPYYAGLRIGEVVGLDVADVSLSARKGTLRVLGKGRDDGKIRTVPMHADLRGYLQAWLAVRPTHIGAGLPALLLSARGTRITDRAARTIITAVGDSAGITDTQPFGPHVLRHTFATQLIRHGVDLVTVAELLGHARLDTVRLYTLPTDTDRAAAVDQLLTDH